MDIILKKRLERFKANKRGYYSFVLFIVLFVVTFCAELIANDKPIMVSYNNRLYFPMVKFYPETAFGGDFETEADFSDDYVRSLITDNGGYIIDAPIPFSYDTIDRLETRPAPAAPSSRHLLGTDDRQRDVLARCIYGFRISIL